ncbi:MAG: hypothetical protein NC313_14650 [Butyrivibrio sp.]|nr:hypothetical protein [Butyrivibrio sp.]
MANITNKKRIICGIIGVILILIGVGIFGVLLYAEKMEDDAKNAPNESLLLDEESRANYLTGNIKMLKEERKCYVMQVTVENTGDSDEDFTGTLQVIFTDSYYYTYLLGSVNCAYNTEIAIPAQEKRQFTITVPQFACDDEGMCALNFINEDGKLIQTISQDKILLDIYNRTFLVGVLSDNFEGLQFMAADGINSRGEMELTELNNDNIKELLDELRCMIIDQFNVASLSGDNIQAIQDWVKDGGWLIIGTGEYAEQTLSGFDKDFIDIDILGISEPGEENFLSVQENPYYFIGSEGIDYASMAVADLYDNSNTRYFYTCPTTPAMCSSIEDGAVMILNCSLGDKELQKLSFSSVNAIYREVKSRPKDNLYDSDAYSNIYDVLFNFINKVDDDSDKLKGIPALIFFVLAFVIVILARAVGLRGWHLLCVCVAGIIMMYVSGIVFAIQNNALTGYEKETRVYSVTTQRVDGNRADTYLLAKRNDDEPWEIRLKDNYERASQGDSPSILIDGSYGYGADDYYYLVSNDDDGISVGIKPGEDKEAFFYAEGSTESKGTISCQDFRNIDWRMRDRNDINMTLTNGTDFDMEYVAIWRDYYILIFSDLKAGETLDLRQAAENGRCIYEGQTSDYEKLYRRLLPIYDKSSNKEYPYELDDMAALITGLGIAEDEKPKELDRAIIIGLVKEYDKVVDDECNETSYGCFYTYAEPGEDQ